MSDLPVVPGATAPVPPGAATPASPAGAATPASPAGVPGSVSIPANASAPDPRTWNETHPDTGAAELEARIAEAKANHPDLHGHGIMQLVDDMHAAMKRLWHHPNT